MTAIPDTEVKVIVGEDGEELSVWQRYDIESSMLTPANAFSFTAANNDGELTGVVGKGDEVKVLVDGDLQMIGRVDDVEYSSDDQGSRVEITGRDLFGYLADCSAALQQYHQKSLEELAEMLTADWVETWGGDAPTTKIPKVKVEPGETVLEVLQRESKKDNVIVWLTADGEGQIGHPSYSGAPAYNLYHYKRSSALRIHNNVISASVRESQRDQFSSITVYGTTGNTKANYGTSSRARGIAVDTDIVDRPLIISDGNVRTLKQAQNRADLEVARRKFDALVLQYTVKGHYGERPDGRGGVERSLWEIDTLVDVVDELSGHEGEFYIVRRRFRGDDAGRFTDLELRQKEVWLA